MNLFNIQALFALAFEKALGLTFPFFTPRKKRFFYRWPYLFPMAVSSVIRKSVILATALILCLFTSRIHADWMGISDLFPALISVHMLLLFFCYRQPNEFSSMKTPSPRLWMNAGILAACSILMLTTASDPSPQAHKVAQNFRYQTLCFAEKRHLDNDSPETSALVTLADYEGLPGPGVDPDESDEAQRLAVQAWDLRYDQINVALHMMSRALQLEDSEDIRSKANDILHLAAFTFEEAWRAEIETVTALAISPDEEIIAIGVDYGQFTLIDARGREMTSVQAHDNSVDGLSFSPDGTLLAAGSHDDYFSIWELSDQDLSLDARHFYGNDWVRDLAFSPDGSELYVTGDYYYSLVYDLDSLEVTDTLGGHDFYIYALAVNETGDVLISGDGDGLVRAWSKVLGTWKEAGKIRLRGKVSDLRFVSSQTVIAALGGGSVVELDLSDLSDMSSADIISDGGQDFMAAMHVGDRVIAGGEGRRLEFRETENSGMVLMDTYIGEIEAMTDGTLLVGGGYMVMKGNIVPTKTLSVEELKAGGTLPELSLEEKLTYNLWTKEDVDGLDGKELKDLFDVIAYNMDGYAWSGTNLNELGQLYAEKGVDVLETFRGGGSSVDPAVKSVINGAGSSSFIFSQALSLDGTDARMLQWLALAGNPDFSWNFRLFATKKAFALYPQDKWGRLLAENLSEVNTQLAQADQLLEYGCDANSATFSPDGSYLFVTTDRSEYCDGGYLYPVENGMPEYGRGISFPNQNEIMWQGAFSADGQRMSSASTDGTVIIYNLNGGTEHIFANEGGEVGFTDARILRNGDVITTDANGLVLRWRMGGIVPEEVLFEHRAEARKIALVDNESKILSVGHDGTLNIWTAYGAEAIDVNSDGIEDIDISADESSAVMGLVGGGAVVLDLSSMQTTEIDNNDGVGFQAVAFSPDGETIYVGTEGGILIAYNKEGHQLWELKIHQGAIYDIDIDPNGQTLVAASGDDLVSVWSLSSLEQDDDLWTTLPWDEHLVDKEDWASLLAFAGKAANEEESLAFIQRVYENTPGGDSKDNLEDALGQNIFYELSGRKIKQKGGLKMFQGIPEGIHGIFWSANLQKMIVLGSQGGFFMLDDEGGHVALDQRLKDAEPRCIAALPDGRWAVADPNGVYVLNRDFELERTISPHNSFTIYDITASPDGAYLATASADNDLALIHAETLEFVRVSGHSNEANAVEFRPDGSGMVSGADDASVKFWDLQGNLIQSVNVGGNVWSLAISPDGERIVAGTNEGDLVLLDADGTEYKTWQTSDFAFWAITFAPDGQSFTAGDNNGHVFVYGRNGEAVFDFDTGESNIYDIAYSPDGKYVFIPTTGGEVYRLMLDQ